MINKKMMKEKEAEQKEKKEAEEKGSKEKDIDVVEESSVETNSTAIEDTDENSVEPITFNDIQFSKSKGKTREISKTAGVLGIINSKKNGKRITIGASVYQEINCPEKIYFGFTEDEIIIAGKMPGNDNDFEVKSKGEGKKGIIYSSELVKEITDMYNLQFDDRVSITFYDVEYKTVDGQKVAIIKIEE